MNRYFIVYFSLSVPNYFTDIRVRERSLRYATAMEDISSYINKICSAYTTRNYKIKDKIIAWNSKSDRVFRLNTSATIENRIQKER